MCENCEESENTSQKPFLDVNNQSLHNNQEATQNLFQSMRIAFDRT